MRGFGFDGGHFEDQGIDEAGNVIDVADHRHEVSLDIARLQFQLEYTFDEPWSIRWRLPIDIKTRSSHISAIDPLATPVEIEAMERNLLTHHPSRTIRGFGDIDMLLCWHKHNVGTDGGLFSAAVGTSVPLGRIEKNPYSLGSEGAFHEHIQLGTGSFDPMMELSYSRPIGDDLIISAYGQGRYPVGENEYGYRASRSVQGGIGALKPMGAVGSGESSFGLVGLLYQHIDRATWDGEIDINSGFTAVSGTVGFSWKDEDFRNWTLSLILPISLETPGTSEGTFEPGPILSLGVGF
ncbi:MAG: hypothetical protein OSB09_10060 [Planctomycetota bacterium]|nr:hypothetical protein [Planctomycetota bacterium]